jgi:ABC transporter DrrB family efflux protein
MGKLMADSVVVFGRALRRARRQPQMAFVFPVAFPVFIVVLMSQLYRDIADVPGFPTGTYIAWIAPGAVLMAAMFGAGASASALVADAETGYLDRLRLLPIHPASLLLGRLLFDTVRVVVAGIVVLGVSVALGAEVASGWMALPGMVTLLALWAIAYGGLFILVGLRSRSQEKLLALVPMFMPIAFLSTVFVPRSQMPTWIAAIARVNPYSYVVDGVRTFMTGGFRWWTFATAVVACLATIALTQVRAASLFGRLVRAD